jgi:hypothetical protein
VKHYALPSHGGRATLRRVQARPAASPETADTSADGATAEHVVYEAEWATVQGVWRGRVSATTAGQVEFELDPATEAELGPAPAWLVDWSLQLVRTIARTVARDTDAEWPRRLTRWRASPEER